MVEPSPTLMTRPNFVQRSSETDNYSTPRWAVDALFDQGESFHGITLEPACGEGNIVRATLDRFPDSEVHSSDLRLLPNPDLRVRSHSQEDFFTATRVADNVITNPPFSIAQEFVEEALRKAKCKVAFLMRLQFLEGKKRYHFFQESPPTYVYVFSERLSLYPEGHPDAGEFAKGGTMAYAWYVWDKRMAVGEPSSILWIPPRQRPRQRRHHQ